ncbi:MAG: hypothetical protein IKP33_04425, partial [Prevotella sp.]|nr:hypothetical protein [Prevotella sp.]
MAWADDVTTTYKFTSKSWTATCNGASANWTSGKDGAGFSNDGIQVTTSVSGANGTSPVSFTNVTKIVATYNTNKSAGAGSIVAKIGENTATSNSVKYSGGSDGRTANFTTQFDYETPQSGNVTITVNTTTNSIYLVSVAITTSTGSGDTRTATTVEIDASGIKNTNRYASTVAGTLAAVVKSGDTSIEGAAVTWSGDNDEVATINESTGAVTLVGAGSVNFTASYAGDEDYQPSSETYQMTVTNDNPNLETIWSEDFSSYDKGDAPDGGDYNYACTNGGGTTQIYTSATTGGESPELLVAKNNGTFSATIPLLKSNYGYSGDLVLTYKTNANALNVKTNTEGITVDGEAEAGKGVTFSTYGEHTVIFKGVTTTTDNITIVFTAT